MEPKRYYDNGTMNYTPYMEYAPYVMAEKYKDNMKSYTSRRMYMESKHNVDRNKSVQELMGIIFKYVRKLSY